MLSGAVWVWWPAATSPSPSVPREPITAKRARRIGLVHEIAHAGQLDAAVDDQVGMLLHGGPVAIRECKELIHMVDGHLMSADQVLRRRTAELIAQLRVSGEGQEGLAAFLDRRRPTWAPTD